MPLVFHKARGASRHIESKIDIGLAGRQISRKSMFRLTKAGEGRRKRRVKATKRDLKPKASQTKIKHLARLDTKTSARPRSSQESKAA